MDSDKAGDSHHLLDELLGIDRRGFDDDERTVVLSRSDPPPAPKQESTDVGTEGAAELDDEALTAHAPEVAQRPAVDPAPIESAPALHYEEEPPLQVEANSAQSETEEFLDPIHAVESEDWEDRSADETQRREALKNRSFAAQGSENLREDDALIGELVDGRYRVLSVLGIGGIGIVYLCRHELLEKPVAMKVLRSEYVLHEDLNERFLNEARAASAIKSPRIVDTLDVGTLPAGAPYFVMEYVDGETLAALLDREGAVDIARALDVARQIAEGLEAAHAAGVVHRDLKPENVFLAQQADGLLYAKIFDFGIAKVARARKRLTYAGAVFGTPHYMSPEQARGEAVDLRSDLYALGVMLFEMVTGTVPFDGEDPLAVMSQHVDRAPPLLATVTGWPVAAGLERLVARCLAKDPSHRYNTASEIVADLLLLQNDPEPTGVLLNPTGVAAIAASAPFATAPAPRGETLHAHVVPATEPPRLRRGRVAGLAIGAALLVGGVVWAASSGSNSRLDAASAPAASVGVPSAVARAQAAPRMGSTPVRAAPELVEVHFVLSPIDAHVFRGDDDLGPMPVSVNVLRGEPLTLTVRRKGYITRKVVVDGDDKRVVVGMVRADPPPKPPTLARRKAN